MFAKLSPKLPLTWLYQGLAFALLGSVVVPSSTPFFLGFAAIVLSSLAAQLVLSLPFPRVGVERYWLQLILAQACKWFAFSIIIWLTISFKFIDGSLFVGVIVAQLIVVWNYRKYG